MPKKKRWIDKDTYIYLGGEYVRQKLADDSDCQDYRIKPLPKPGRALLLCRTPEGKMKAVALLRHRDVDLRTVKDQDERKDIKKARQIWQEENMKRKDEGVFTPVYMVREVSMKLQIDTTGEPHVYLADEKGEYQELDLKNLTPDQMNLVKKLLHFAFRRHPEKMPWLVQKGYGHLVQFPGEPIMEE